MTKTCPDCSNQNDVVSKFCGFCGALLEDSLENQKSNSDQTFEQEQFAPIDKTDETISIPEAFTTEEMSFKQLYFSSKGRIGLNTFWKKGIVPLLVGMVLIIIIGSAFQNTSSGGSVLLCIGAPIFLLYLYSIVMIFVKRFHDINRSGWTYLNPFVLLWVIKDLYFSSGTPGPNKYGDRSY